MYADRGNRWMRVTMNELGGLRGIGLRALLAGVAVGATLAIGAEAGADAGYARAQTARAAQGVAALVDRGLQVPALAASALAGDRGELPLALVRAYLMLALSAIDRAEPGWRRVDEIARRRSDSALLRLALEHRAEMALLGGDYVGSREHAESLLAWARADDDNASAAIAHGYLGILARRRGDLDAAFSEHTKALDILRADGDEARLALTMTNLGTVLRDRGDFAGALELHLAAMAIRERSGDRLETSYRNVALLYREIEDEETARDYFRRAIEVAATRPAPESYAPVIGSYASLLNDTGEFTQALAAANEALAIDVALGNRSHQGLELLESGRALLGLGRHDEANAQLETALEIGRELGQREIVARALLHLAEAAIARRDLLRSRGLIDEAIAALESARLRPQLVQAYAVRERIALAEHDPESALRFARRRAEQRELLLGTRASRQLSALQARHAREDAEQRLALLQKDNELQATRLRADALQRRLGVGALASLAVALLLALWRFSSVSRLNRTLARKNREIEAQRGALESANTQLSERADELYRAAISDPLTGVFNRTHLRERIDAAITSSLASGSDLAVLVLDFDHFKQINDVLGHLHGDRVLIAGVQAMQRCLGKGDVLGRFGGEEFVIVLANRSADEAAVLAECVRNEVCKGLAGIVVCRNQVTVSIGLATLAQLREPSVDSLLDAADRAMYEAKARGRNRVVRFASAA